MRYLVLLFAVLGLVLPAARNRVVTQATPAPFVFTAAGDHGTGTRTDLSMDVVKSSGSSFYLALGDHSYVSGGEQSWCTNFKARFNDVEILYTYEGTYEINSLIVGRAVTGVSAFV